MGCVCVCVGCCYLLSVLLFSLVTYNDDSSGRPRSRSIAVGYSPRGVRTITRTDRCIIGIIYSNGR